MNTSAAFSSLFVLTSLLVEASIRYVDLSHNYDESTVVWPGEEKYKMTVKHNETMAPGFWYQIENISTATHCGTHLDAPCHFSKGAWSVEQIPISRLITPAAVVDISEKTSDNRDYDVSVKDLQEWESKNGKLPPGAVLLISTGWAKYWPDKKKYFGTDTDNTSLLHFPGISPDTAQWIVSERNISGLGIDVLSVDGGRRTIAYETHVILSSKNVYFLENVGDMSELPATGVMLYAMPMKLKSSSGAPCRIIAAISEDDPACGAAGVGYSFRLVATLMMLCYIKDVYRKVL